MRFDAKHLFECYARSNHILCIIYRSVVVEVDVHGVRVERHLSHVTRHTSHVARHKPHVTRHTSHVTRHTSHATRHTSHATYLREQPARVQMQHVYPGRHANCDDIGMTGVTLLQLHDGPLFVRLLVQVGVFHLGDVSAGN